MKKSFILILAFLIYSCSSSKPELLNEEAFLDDATFDSDTTAVSDTINVDNTQNSDNQPLFKKTITLNVDSVEQENSASEKQTKQKEANKGTKNIRSTNEKGSYVQCGAFSTEDNAMKFYQKYSGKLKEEIFIEYDKTRKLYIVRTASYNNRGDLERVLRNVRMVIKDAFIKQ